MVMGITLRNILLLGLCLSLGACAFKKEDAEDKQRQDLANDVAKQIQEGQRNSVPDLNSKTVTATFEEQDIGFYTFRLTWPENIGSVEVYLNQNHEATVSGKNNFTKLVRQDETISYHFRAYATTANGGVFVGEYGDIVTAPKDLLMYQSLSLKEDLNTEVKRAYFRNDTQIITNGYNLKIKAKRLTVVEVIENKTSTPTQFSQIVTFPTTETTTTTSKTSKIEIYADHAEGKLQIAMIGKDGADGKDGLINAKNNNWPILNPVADAGANGTDGKQSRAKTCAGKDREFCQQTPPECTLQPTAGGQGKQGEAGYDATEAIEGGSTGDLTVKILDNSEFSLDIYQKAGKGGRGGTGSPGQLGGPGGQPGYRPDLCSPAIAGSKGGDGNPGKSTKDAADGTIGKIETDVKNIRVIQDSK